jgi:hypothetical protein
VLHEIPAGIDIWEAEADVEDSSPANQMWDRLVAIDGVGPVRAGKLLARKRPRLIPIWDSVIESLLPRQGDGYWTYMRECLAEDDFHRTVDGTLRPDWLSPLVSTLRLLDAALWMKHSNGRAATRVRESIARDAGGKENP